jgi:hypothetical protein
MKSFGKNSIHGMKYMLKLTQTESTSKDSGNRYGKKKQRSAALSMPVPGDSAVTLSQQRSKQAFRRIC